VVVPEVQVVIQVSPVVLELIGQHQWVEQQVQVVVLVQLTRATATRLASVVPMVVVQVQVTRLREPTLPQVATD
jgi:hypothetical protein